MSKQLVNIIDLRCGQMALGMFEVRGKAKEFKKLSKKSFLAESKKDPLILVRDPEKNLLLIDGHHRALAAWLTGNVKMHAKVKYDFSKKKISQKAFWNELKKRNCVHLYDQCGNGPHETLYLPLDIRGLGDDPYRSLAWLVKCKGGFGESGDRFADFKWANFFRKRKLLKGRTKEDFKEAKVKALRLAHSPKARHLPGYKGARK